MCIRDRKNKREGGRHKRRPSRVTDTILVVVVLLCGILLAGNILKETAQRKREEEIRKLAVQEEAPAGALRDGDCLLYTSAWSRR